MPDARDPVVTFFGVALLGVGVLMATLCGLCTLVMLAFSMSEPGMAATSLIVGGVPFAIGLLLIWVGRQMLRPPAKPAAPEDAP
jgi:hypothetical protein